MSKRPTNRMRYRRKDRKGATIVVIALTIIIIIGMTAFAVETGRMCLLRNQMQTAVDSGALAASLKLKEDPSKVEEAGAAAREFIQRNKVGFVVEVPDSAIQVQVGTWDDQTKTFTATTDEPNCVSVNALQDNEPFLFGRIFGKSSFGAPGAAIATASGSELDIMMVLDLSGSMASQGRIQALQNAAPEFVDVIEEIGGDDMIGVMGFSAHPDSYDPDDEGHTGTLYMPAGLNPDPSYHVGVLEEALTNDWSYLENSVLTSSILIANKYTGTTGTGASIRDAAHYLINGAEAREDVKKVILLMSDGYANIPSGSGPSYATQMASYAAGLEVKIYTVSLGNDADVSLMEQIATITGGEHFDARGVGTATLTENLTEAFRNAAATIKRTALVQ